MSFYFVNYFSENPRGDVKKMYVCIVPLCNSEILLVTGTSNMSRSVRLNSQENGVHH